MIIRKATIDDADSIAAILLLAMEDSIHKKTGTTDNEKARSFLLHFVQRENNQYSYQNCLVAEDGDRIIGALNSYDGGKLDELRKPVQDYVQKHFDRNPDSENETQAGEHYLDSIGVIENQQGKGVGKKLLVHLIEEYVQKKRETLGLLVAPDNQVAKALYEKLGFKPVGKKNLLGKEMEHLQISV